MKPHKIEQLANEIRKFLVENKMWIDVRIYFNGKVITSDGEEYEANPKEYFEYVAEPHILSMSFEGPFYRVMNDISNQAYMKRQEFSLILLAFGLYYELGNAWNLTCFER